MGGALAVAIGVLLAALLVFLQRRFPLLQYLYLARFSLLVATALLLLPLVCLDLAPSLLGSLFDVGPHGVVMITWMTPLAAWGVMLTLATLLRYAPDRFNLPNVPLPRWLVRHRVLF